MKIQKQSARELADLEMTKLCAKAMGYVPATSELPGFHVIRKEDLKGSRPWKPFKYDPLNDDAQVMALVRRFHVYLEFDGDYGWIAGEKLMVVVGVNADISRAIVECVAKMQRARDDVSVRGSDNATPK